MNPRKPDTRPTPEKTFDKLPQGGDPVPAYREESDKRLVELKTEHYAQEKILRLYANIIPEH